MSFTYECAARRLVPTRCPVHFLTISATVSGSLALRANFEVLQLLMAEYRSEMAEKAEEAEESAKQSGGGGGGGSKKKRGGKKQTK